MNVLPLENVVPLTVGLLVVLAVVSVGLFLRGRRQELVVAVPPGLPRPIHDPFVHGSLQERRASPRRRGGSVAVLVSDAEGVAPPDRALVVDRSTGGLCLALDGPQQVGSVLTVRVAYSPNQVAWTRVEVRHCRRAGGDWEVGCRFVQTLPLSQLWQFG